MQIAMLNLVKDYVAWTIWNFKSAKVQLKDLA
ncbi:protein of unknown function [Pseudodesulfovibrio piezophilus C1TLV30]|uniref:Uncharacterized protein n=1 Tax=Pseudodesulfovibrio piezophilus (strain DSM 21447 / JCM 15486 / C1TLV30) TaxID=1322246 RepID=M1WLG7_PSEP2|nr:protein of unknown function [Pseudodesulfovibrio piezophilus C1TLV30]